MMNSQIIHDPMTVVEFLTLLFTLAFIVKQLLLSGASPKNIGPGRMSPITRLRSIFDVGRLVSLPKRSLSYQKVAYPRAMR